MGYLHIDNLYKEQTILLFRECYALEKIHGTSAHISWVMPKNMFSTQMPRQLSFFSGGESHARFVALFDQDKLRAALEALTLPPDKDLTIYGEAYGGSQQGMSDTYGKELKFVVFDVQIGEFFLDVPVAEEITKALGLEFVHYRKISTDIAALDAERDMPSVQAIRNGISHAVNLFGPVENPKPREGIVLRPLREMRLNNDKRVISKHKGKEFEETRTSRKVEVDPAKLQKLAEANAVADEWVTLNRLGHVLQKIPDHCMEKMPVILAAMLEDVLREGAGEIDLTKDEQGIHKAIKSATAKLYKQFLQEKLHATSTSQS